MPEDNSSKDMCKCGVNPAQEPHECPYRADLYNDSEYECTCCNDCQYECRRDT